MILLKAGQENFPVFFSKDKKRNLAFHVLYELRAEFVFKIAQEPAFQECFMEFFHFNLNFRLYTVKILHFFFIKFIQRIDTVADGSKFFHSGEMFLLMVKSQKDVLSFHVVFASGERGGGLAYLGEKRLTVRPYIVEF